MRVGPVGLAMFTAATLLLGRTGPLAAQQAPLSGCIGLDITTTPTGVVKAQNTGPHNQTFTVTNCGSTPITGITLSCEQLAPVSCGSVTPSSRSTLAGGAAFTVTLTYSVGSPGIGQAYLRASWGEDDTAIGILGVTVHGPPLITLTPASTGPSSRAVVRNRMPIIRAQVAPQYAAVDTTKTVLAWRSDTVTRWRADSLTVARWNRGLIEWAVDSVRGLNVANGDSALMTVTACSIYSLCTTLTRWAVLPYDSLPVVGLTGVPVGALGSAFAAPFGPGLSVAGAEVETGVVTVPYFSMNAPRTLGLVYSTRQSYPRVLVPVDVEPRLPPGATFDQVTLRLFDGTTKLDSLKLTAPTCATGGTARCRGVLAGDFSAGSFPSPTRKWLRVEVAVTASGTTRAASDSVEVVVVDRRNSMYGNGWWPSVAAKVVAAGGDRLLVAPTGAVTVYRGSGDSLYLPPPGSFMSLTRTATGWALRARGDSAVVRFDSYGRLAASVDQNGNRDSLVYVGATDTLAKVRDPVGSEITLAYTASRLSSISTSGGRSATVTVSGGLLTSFTPATGPGGGYTATFTYQSVGTGTLLQRVIGVLGDTTAITYDPGSRYRPTLATLPKVRNEVGDSVSPTLGYTAVETRGLGSLVSLDSAGTFVEVRDPRNQWTRAVPNRWGQARLSWDTLGVLARSAFNGDGFLRWSEGKTADSSRSYVAYDNLWRVSKRYLVRPAGEGGVLRLDSLVYDANHRVVQRIDARGQVWKTDFDVRGNAIRSIRPNTPGPDTTQVWYRTDGMVDSTRAPGDPAATLYKYSGPLKILYQTITPSRDTVARNLLWDAYGRPYQVERKVPVALGKMQWRRTQTFFSPSSNLVDSIRTIRSFTCDTPCATPTWPVLLDSDSVLVERVRVRYDRAGRDSVRISERGIKKVTVRDRLGRVVRAYPYEYAAFGVDSFAYDVAGNLRKSWTRRGHLITAEYDSRNRDTLTVIPTVGTVQKAYAGPLDQLTRIWVTGLVDSVGQARPDLSLVYDQRGRLRADTVWSGGVARVTTYTPDRYERDSLMTDALGGWRTRYETVRGMPDTLETPLGDTLALIFDWQGRYAGGGVRSAGIRVTYATGYTADGAPKRWATTMQVPAVWTAGVDDQGTQNNALPALQPVWSQIRGLGGAVDTLRAELFYDARERLSDWDGIGSLSGGVTESYTLDRAGNLGSTGGGEVFHATTNRLLRRANGASRAWTYTYDAAGNLVQAVDSGTTSITYSYAYDALNRLVRVAQGGTLIARYAYDVLGRRIAKRVYSAATGGTVGFTRFVYHGGQVAFETDSAGSTIGTRYVWGPGTDNLVAFRTTAASTDHYYVATDKLGSVHQIIKRDGTWVMTYGYTPYGAVAATAGSGVALRYRWTGREWDAETGWYFHRARYYDPGQRRFVQEDPAGEAGGENRYAYVGGRPLVATDPSGLGPDPKVTQWPSDCCAASHAGWDGWFGFAGSLLSWTTDVYFRGEYWYTVNAPRSWVAKYLPDYEAYLRNFIANLERDRGSLDELTINGSSVGTVMDALADAKALSIEQFAAATALQLKKDELREQILARFTDGYVGVGLAAAAMFGSAVNRTYWGATFGRWTILTPALFGRGPLGNIVVHESIHFFHPDWNEGKVCWETNRHAIDRVSCN